MSAKLRRLYAYPAVRFTLYGLLISLFSLAILSWSQFLQPLELGVYDLNFRIRSPETTDERIVIVKWDEEDIDAFKETTISDRTITLLLQKILEQKPRVIGLDIYRDIPVSSPQLSDGENLKYSKALQDLFSTTDNILGIEKVIEPIVNPPSILKQKDLVAASDVPVDEDKIIRRAYIYPETNKEGKAAGLPYLGARLAYEYLADENFHAEGYGPEAKALNIFREDKKTILKPLESFIGRSNNDRYSFSLLVNWRKANPAFRSISVIEVLNNRVAANYFTDKIVLVGGMSTTTTDRHIVPLNRFNERVFYGVEIPAHLASSIISAALDGRTLINPAPKLVEFLLTAISAGLILYILYGKRDLRSINLYYSSFVYTLGISVVLLWFSFISMANGYWLPVTTSIGNIWVLYLATNYYLYRLSEEKRSALFKAFIEDFNHGLGNRLSSIISSRNTIDTFAREIKADLPMLEDSHFEDLSGLDEERMLDTIIRRSQNIKNQVARIRKYQERIRNFVNFGYLNNFNSLENINVNAYINEVVEQFLSQSQSNHDDPVPVSQTYDPKLRKASVDKLALRIVIENLLDNALYAVSAGEINDRDRLPKIKIESRLKNKSIQISIEDNGNGISSVNRQKIFLPFVSFKSRETGQGIGLFLVAKIARIYNGSIKLETEEGKGSKFIFTLPFISSKLK